LLMSEAPIKQRRNAEELWMTGHANN